MHNRRDMLAASIAALLAAGGWLPTAALAAWNKAAFDAKGVEATLKALGGSAPTASDQVTLTGPDIAENGAVVQVGCACSAANVNKLLVLVEKNPYTLAAVFETTPAVEPNFTTRIKMGQSSHVYAVAMLEDGKVLYASKEIKVTLGGCGG